MPPKTTLPRVMIIANETTVILSTCPQVGRLNLSGHEQGWSKLNKHLPSENTLSFERHTFMTNLAAELGNEKMKSSYSRADGAPGSTVTHRTTSVPAKPTCGSSVVFASALSLSCGRFTNTVE